jgi:arylsulfatase A-like enzyme
MKLLVLIVRGLQAGAIGPYGNRWTETFSLDTLACNGVVFDQYFAVHPSPTLARRVWRTGCYHFPQPTPDGSTVGPWPDLLDVLLHRGVRSRLILECREEEAAFLQGWQHVEQLPDTESVIECARVALQDLADNTLLWVDLATLLPPWKIPDEIVQAYFAPAPPAEEEDDEEEDENEAEAIEVEPHEPLFDPPEGNIDPNDDELYLRIRETYAAALSYVDRLLGTLLDGLADDVHVLVTSDAGLSLGEHGVIGRLFPTLHEEVVHVPLIVYGPGCQAGLRVSALTGSIDLAPTIADLACACLVGAQGSSLRPFWEGQPSGSRDVLGLGVQVGESITWGLRSASWSLIEPVQGDHSPRLYNKPDDQWEVNDVGQHHMEEVENMDRRLHALVEQCPNEPRTR